jgi:hypothetical protein
MAYFIPFADDKKTREQKADTDFDVRYWRAGQFFPASVPLKPPEDGGNNGGSVPLAARV